MMTMGLSKVQFLCVITIVASTIDLQRWTLLSKNKKCSDDAVVDGYGKKRSRSLINCAAMCLHHQQCNGFAFGNSSNEGECQLCLSTDRLELSDHSVYTEALAANNEMSAGTDEQTTETSTDEIRTTTATAANDRVDHVVDEYYKQDSEEWIRCKDNSALVGMWFVNSSEAGVIATGLKCMKNSKNAFRWKFKELRVELSECSSSGHVVGQCVHNCNNNNQYLLWCSPLGSDYEFQTGDTMHLQARIYSTEDTMKSDEEKWDTECPDGSIVLGVENLNDSVKISCRGYSIRTTTN